MIPKKRYRDKVKNRLDMVKALFADRPRIEDMFKRVFAGTEHFGKGSDFHNQMEQFYMLLNTDLPALLEAFDSL